MKVDIGGIEKIDIGGIRIDNCSFEVVNQRILEHIFTGRVPEYVVTPNAHHIVTLQKDAYFRQIYRDAFLVVPDGVSLLWAANFLGTPLQGRVNGTDLFERLCGIAADRGLRVFLLGGRPGAAETAARALCTRYPKLQVVGTYCPPYGFEKNLGELEQINERIKAAKPDFLFVGLGAPKQEYWIYENYKRLGVPIAVGIGVSFELVAGMVRRAPKWMQKLGLEWFFRLLMEPRRLWQRYLVGNLLFILLVIRQRLGID